MGLPIDLIKLDGTWRLAYTSAPDVLILFEAAARLPFFQVFLLLIKLISNSFSYVSELFIALSYATPLLVMKCLFPEIIIHEEA